MNQYNLGFISDADIFKHVEETVKLYSTSTNLDAFNKNIIDPIKLTFDSKVYGRSLKETITNECIRQMDKSNNNSIGYFHQNIFKYAGNGWTVPKEGFDVVNNDLHIFVEMKNKHNTMNSASAQKTYINMQNKLLEDDKSTCMLVEVIASRSQDKPWIVSVNKKQFCNEHIRRVSMDKFYEIVFGDKDAFCKLCKAIPKILDDVVIKAKTSGNTVFSELEAISPDINKSLFLLAFKTYEGFNDF